MSNVFVHGACVYPQNPGYNPTDTVGALVYWSAQAIREQYLKHPGLLVRKRSSPTVQAVPSGRAGQFRLGETGHTHCIERLPW